MTNKVLYMTAVCLTVLLYGCGGGGGSEGTDSGETFVTETSSSSGHPSKWIDSDSIGSGDFHGSSVSFTYSTPKGHALYSLRCSGCHGSQGAGYIGPNITGQSSSNIKNAMNSVAYMKWLANLSTDEDVQAIADYLSNTSSTSTYSADASTCISCHGDDYNGGISKIGCYSCHDGPDGKVGHPSGWTSQKSNSVRFHGYYAKSYETSCAACHGSDLRGPLVASCYKCHGTCNGGNCAPVAEAGGSQSVTIGTVVTLDGSGSSDVNGDSLAYNWSFTSKPASSSAALSNSAAVKPAFTADAAGTYTISLVVNDGKADSESDTVNITATSAATAVSFASSIQPIFNSNCISCHSSTGSANFLPLTSDAAYNNLVNKSATRTGNPASGTLVIPYDSANSVLYQRVSGIGLPAGENTMPPNSSLNTADQSLIKTWIDNGAAQ